MNDARMALWLQIIPTLGESFYKINETVDFGRPGLLLAAIEIALYRNPEGERTQLLLAFWAATLVLEGKGDPFSFTGGSSWPAAGLLSWLTSLYVTRI